MRVRGHWLAGSVLLLAAAGLTTACGEEGSSGTRPPVTAGAGGCAPVSGQQLLVLTDDKKLQTVDNIVPAVSAKAAKPELLAALDKVSAALDTQKLISLNRAVAVERKTPKAAAEAYAASSALTTGITKGASGSVIVGAGNFAESRTLAELYRIALSAAGYRASVREMGNRELYEPALERGEVQVMPEYLGTLTEFLNKKLNGSGATPIASADLDKTYSGLKDLGRRVGLGFGTPSPAADQNAFAVTKAFADKHSLSTLSDLAAKCSGRETVLGGPPECPQRPFCQPGLEKTYGLTVGSFASLDAGGPQTMTALTTGKISVGLVFSSDGALAAG